MANLTRVLGTMLATGMAGRSRRGPSFASSPFGTGGLGGMGMGMAARGRRGGMDMKQMAGLGALGYLAYKAYQDHQKNTAGQTAGNRGGGASGGTSGGAGGAGGGIGGILGNILGGGQAGGGQAGGGGGSLGDRLSDMFRPQQRQEPQAAEDAYPEVEMEDQKALLLIRAMIAAANADGEISPDERQRILDKLDEAGAGPEEHRIIERELADPPSTDALVRDVHDQETAEQVYLASVIAMEPDTQAERSYLQYLAARLNLDPQRAEELHDVA